MVEGFTLRAGGSVLCLQKWAGNICTGMSRGRCLGEYVLHPVRKCTCIYAVKIEVANILLSVARWSVCHEMHCFF